MNFNIETSRRQTITAADRAREIFSDQIRGSLDASFTDVNRNKIIAVSGLEYPAPACMHIINEPHLNEILSNYDEDLLIRFDDDHSLYSKAGKIETDEEFKNKVKKIHDTILSSPGTIDEDGGLKIDLRSYRIGSHYGVNLLLGDRCGYDDCLQSTPKSVLDELGRGSFRGRQEKQVLATRYVLSPEENGEPANRQFYLTENGRQIFYSLDVNTNVKEAFCEHLQNRTVITYETECGLKIIRTIFLLPQQENMPNAVEVQRIRIINLTDKERDLRIVCTGMFGITDPGTLAGDIIFANVVVESELYYKNGRPVAITAHHQPKECDKEKRFAMLLVNGEGMDEHCSSLYDFIGSGSLERPEMISHLSNAHARRQAAFFAMAKSFRLKDEILIDSFTGMDDNNDDVRKQFDEDLDRFYETYKDPSELTKTYDRMIEDNDRYFSFLTTENGDPLHDSYISKNLPFQVLYQTFVSRSFAWTQKSYRETGFREIQDIYASMYYMHAQGKDGLVKKLIDSWAENVFEFGYAYHNFTSRGKEPGMCSDDALWLIQAVYRYIRLSGDLDYLKQELKVAGSDKTRPLYKTLESIITYSGKISVGKHGLPLLDKADWNDCLRLDKNVMNGPQKEEAYRRQLSDRKQEFGVPLDNVQSESVMNACLLKIAADELKEMALKLDLKDTAGLCDEISSKINDSVRNNAWKDDYYARCLINDDRGCEYLGASGDGLSPDPKKKGTYYLNGFSWPLLADIADEEQIGKMLDIVDTQLKTDAGLKLVTPVDYDRLGVDIDTAFYFPGDRENGGVFKHAAMMCTVACLRKAKTVKDQTLARRLKDLAFFMIGKTLPYKTLENPYVLKGNPRFCTQYNNSETGEGIGPILSGTASWLTLALYEVIGFDPDGDLLSFDPVIDGDSYHYELKIGGTLIKVTVDGRNGFRCNENTRYVFDGKECGKTISLPKDGKTHDMEITL